MGYNDVTVRDIGSEMAILTQLLSKLVAFDLVLLEPRHYGGKGSTNLAYHRNWYHVMYKLLL